MRKLKKGKKVVANGRTYKESVPESVIKALNLSDDLFIQEKQQTEKHSKKNREPS